MAVPTQPIRTPRGNAARPSRSDAQPELEDRYLVALAKRGSPNAYERLIRRYRGFVRLKASSYFMLGGDSEDLIQEGLVGLYKAIRDFRTDRESSFRNFAELCITRQIITAVKTASRNKHAPLNQYVSFAQSPAASGDAETTLEEVLPGPDLRGAGRARDRQRGAPGAGLLPRERPLRAREPRPLPLPRRLLVRADRRAPRVRHEDGRQRPPARQAQGRRAHRRPRGARLAVHLARVARIAQLAEHAICNREAVGSIPTPGL